MTDNPKPEPEAQALDLQSEIASTISGHGRTDGHREARAIMELLQEGGWVLPGVPPVNQVLADARQYSDELVLTKLVARVFRTLILGGLVIPETPQAMTWMRTYIDGDDRRHGPLGKPMVWPDSLPTVVQLLRDWGFQPTPTPIPYVSLRPGGPATRSAPDPTGPDPAMVKPVPTRRELVMGSLLDEIAGAALIMAVDRMTAIRAMSAAFDRGASHFDASGILPQLTNLRDHQRQIDQDGVEVAVSRQALDEVLSFLAGETSVSTVTGLLRRAMAAAAELADAYANGTGESSQGYREASALRSDIENCLGPDGDRG
jgi:hypothetical protein